MRKKNIRAVAALVSAVLLLLGGVVTVGATAPQGGGRTPLPAEVYVGGMPFGVKFYTEGILVVGFCDVDTAGGAVNPARAAGLRERDIIIAVNGAPPANASSLTEAVEASGGKPVVLTVKRVVDTTARTGARPSSGRAATDSTTTLTVSVTPARSVSEGRYKTGMWVRDSGAGIGTVTFIVPGSHAFAGLGHGICDGDTGELIAMQRGQVTDVTVSGVDRGRVGTPGAIKGYFAPGKTGTLLGNTACGVYGLFSEKPATATTRIPVGRRRDLHEGEATILCTLDDGKTCAHSVRITAIDPDATGSKCFTLTVTDPALLEHTGGIVQGMSGSPVIQDGKLVGAVTHVLINDPTTGYGIFVENMLRDMPEMLR